MRFDLTDMRLFLNVAEAASITGGAERSHLALASASARIRAMEATLGTPLLERQRRGVRLTPAGRAVVHHARTMLQQVERMHGELRDYARGLKGHVRLLCNTSALVEFLPQTLAAFLVQHPDIDIDLEERLSHQIVDAVAEGLADAGIVADTVDLGDLEVFPFRIDRLVAVVPSRHRLARRRSVAFRDTLADEFVGLSRDSALQEHLTRNAARTGRAFKVRVRVSTFEAICRMVELGVGVGVIPDTAARRCRRSMKIHVVPLTDPWALRHLMICVRRFDDLPAHAKQLVTFLRLAGDERATRRTRPA
ncbi:MAG TPA: LysR substrate-binding domain-containing protein [Alphaproteobacteria bacterium]